MNRIGKKLLILGAISNFGIALLHCAIILIGPPAYVYFGAASLAPLAAQGSPVPALITFGLALAFAGFGVYAFSGAGIVRPLPWVRVGLVFIGSIYFLRGLIVISDILQFIRGAGYPLQQVVFSAASLCIGLAYLLGTLSRIEAFRSEPYHYLKGAKQ